MHRLLPWVAALTIALYQYHISLVAQLTRVSKLPVREFLLPSAAFCLAALIVGAGIDILTSWRRPASLDAVAASGTGAIRHIRLAVLLLLPAYAVGVRLVLFDDWLPLSARIAAQIGSGIFIAASHWVFFTLVPRRLAASVYCAALAAGYFLMEAQRRIFHVDLSDAPAGLDVLLTLHFVIFSALLLAIILVPGIAAANRRKPERIGSEESGDGCWKSSGAIILLLVVFFLMHGMMGSAFIPFYMANRLMDNVGTVMTLTIIVLAGAAWLFRRGFAKGFRWVVLINSIVHLTVPAFSLFKANAPIHWVIHSLVGPLNVLFTAAVMAALALTAPKRWRTSLILLPFVLKAAAVLFIPPLLRAWRDSEVLALAALLTAVGFFVYGQKIDLSALPNETLPAATPPEPPPIPECAEEVSEQAVAEIAVEDPGEKLRLLIEELGERYGLSGREREVAELLVSGKAADVISEHLGLAPATVHTYVRRVVIKTGHTGRKGFVAMVKARLDAED